MTGCSVDNVELLEFYIKNKYPNSTLVVLHNVWDEVENYDNVQRVLQAANLRIADVKDHLIIECDNFEEAKKMEMLVPYAQQYVTIWIDGEMISENT